MTENLNDLILHKTIDELGLSSRTVKCLERAGFTTVSEITKLTWIDLRLKARLNRRSLEEVILKLSELGCYLSDFYEGNFKTIKDYMLFVQRNLRLKTAWTLNVNVLAPDPGKYTKGGKGYTLYFNIDNLTDEPKKLKLIECSVFSHGRQWISDYNYTGYALDDEYVFPGTIRTAGKIWITENTLNGELVQGDYFTILIKDTKENTLFFFKFLYMSDGKWEFYDYYEIDE